MVENKIRLLVGLDTEIEDLEEEIARLKEENNKLEKNIQKRILIIQEVDDFLDNNQ